MFNCTLQFEPKYGRYTWLDSEGFRLSNGKGTLVFEAKAKNDVNCCFDVKQIDSASTQDPRYQGASIAYEIVIGGYRNAKTVIRKRGHNVAAVTSAENKDAMVSHDKFERFWVNVDDGLVTLGKGALSPEYILLQWCDPDPIPDIEFVGMGSWDTRVLVRQVRVLPSFDLRRYTNDAVDFSRILGDPRLSDCTLSFGHRSVRCHRAILASASPLFYSCFLQRDTSLYHELNSSEARLPVLFTCREDAQKEVSIQFNGASEARLLDSLVECLYLGRVPDSLAQDSRAPLHSLLKQLGICPCGRAVCAKFGIPQPIRSSDSNELGFLPSGCEGAVTSPIAPTFCQPLEPSPQLAHSLVNLCESFLTPGSQDSQRATEGAESSSWQAYSMWPLLSHLQTSKLFTDAIFRAGGGVEEGVSAHRAVLACRSEVFRAMFLSGMREGQSPPQEIDLSFSLASDRVPLDTLFGDTAKGGLLTATALPHSPKDLDALVEYLYGSHCGPYETCSPTAPTLQHAVSLLYLADMFGLSGLKRQCEIDLRVHHVNDSTCVALLLVAQSLFCLPLEDACLQWMTAHFDGVSASQDIIRLDPSTLVKALSSDHLVISSELITFRAVEQWVTANIELAPSSPAGDPSDHVPHFRPGDIECLLLCVRYGLLPQHALASIADQSPLYRAFPIVKELVDSALHKRSTDPTAVDATGASSNPAISDAFSTLVVRSAVLSFGDERHSLLASQSKPRKVVGAKELFFTHAGDECGVLYYIGTNFGTRPWKNPFCPTPVAPRAHRAASTSSQPQLTNSPLQGSPMTGSPLNFSASQPADDPPPFLNLDDFDQDAGGSGAPLGVPDPATPHVRVTSSSPSFKFSAPHFLTDRNFHSVCYAVGRPAWWCLDLGKRSRLVCNRYVVRHDSTSCNFLRSWRLQGSLDQVAWTDLRVHNDDHTLSCPGQFGTWAVEPSQPHRFFRILATGPSSHGESKLVLSSVELYGLFFTITDD